MACRSSSTRPGLVLAIALSACAPRPDGSTGATGSETGDSSGDTATTHPDTSTGAVQQPFSAALVSAYLDSISGCSVTTTVGLRVRVTAPADRAIDTATLTSVSFKDWWGGTELDVGAEDLPVAAGATAELRFYLSFDGDVVGLADCGSEPLPSPPVVATFEIAGEHVELAASGSLGCGFDEPPDGGC